MFRALIEERANEHREMIIVLSYVKQQAAGALQKKIFFILERFDSKINGDGGPPNGLLNKHIIIQVTVSFCFVLFFISMSSFNKPHL